MPIKIQIQTPGLNLVASLRDEALVDLIRLTQEHRISDEVVASATTSPSSLPLGGAQVESQDAAPVLSASGSSVEEEVKRKLASMAAGEALNQVGWITYPEKILLLAAWSEARGMSTPWKKEDIQGVFLQAKERTPGNFAREVTQAIKSGWLHAETPRTYSVTRTGWNRLSAASK